MHADDNDDDNGDNVDDDELTGIDMFRCLQCLDLLYIVKHRHLKKLRYTRVLCYLPAWR